MRSRNSPKPKTHSFTDEQIRAKAYEQWQQHPERTEAENWDAAIKALKQERSLLGRTCRVLNYPCIVTARTLHLFQLAVKADTQSAALDVIKAGISALGLAATIFAGVGLYLTYQNGLEQQRLAQAEKQLNTERLITDRFAKAVEQLGSKEINVRIGGIYSLERLAKDSPKDHWTVMEVMTAFVREQSPVPKGWFDKPTAKRKDLPVVTSDVQSTLTVIGRRLTENDPPEKRLDLSKTNLEEASLGSANLQGASLGSANLQGASLGSANLQGASLGSANLQGASLGSANLEEASLGSANLQGAFLFSANLQKASLDNANLQKASLDNANLQKAFLLSANLQGTVLFRANLQEAVLGRANLQKAFLVSTNLQGAFLFSANLQGAFLLATDLRNTKGLTKSQLEGKQPPLLCKVALPESFKDKDKLKDRDCAEMPQDLLRRYAGSFKSLAEAQQFIDEAKQKKWE